MSKRCKLQKEYYKYFGNYKGVGKYSNNYVKWLEDKVLLNLGGGDLDLFYCWDQQALGNNNRCKKECDTCLSVRKE